MSMDIETRPRLRQVRVRLASIALAFAAVLIAPDLVRTQVLDICGCGSIPNLPAFDSRDASTHPPGTVVTGTSVTLPVPEDGVLRFSRFFARNHIRFARNAANTPVTILVSGDFTLDSNTGCCWEFDLRGQAGRGGNTTLAGVAGLGGSGASRGGDGAHQATNFASIGGAGFGAGGGAAGNPSSCGGKGGEFFGGPDLLPLLGGAGGGGGCSNGPSTACSAGGGGGGGGALLVAANGTISIRDYYILADGGPGGNDYAFSGGCARGGGGGSGGAIRLVANRFVGTNTAELYARAGGGASGGTAGTVGRIRLESMDASAQTAFETSPGAQRLVGPTPLVNPLSPTVAIASVAGAAAPVVPLGHLGNVDVIVPNPGSASVDVTTTNVPGGTTVQVTVKPRLGADPISATVPLGTCTPAGVCQATATFNLTPGSYVIEARATFQTQ